MSDQQQQNQNIEVGAAAGQENIKEISPLQEQRQETLQNGSNEKISNKVHAQEVSHHEIQVKGQTENKENAKQLQKTEEKQEKVVVAKAEKIEQVGFFKLFRYSTGKDICFMLIGGLAAAANGFAMPLFALVFGKMIDSFGPEYSSEKVVENASTQSIWFIIIGVGSFICSWIQMYTWMSAGERQAILLRKAYFKAILRQDISWFDKVNPNQLATKVATECFAVQGAIGEKVPTFIMTLSMLVGGFVIAFIFGWELSLVCTAALPFIAIATAIFTYEIQNADAQVSSSYSDAGGLAEQAIHGVKTVKSLNGQDYEEKNYLVTLKQAYSLALKYGIYVGLSLGFLWFLMLADYGLGFWFGSIFVGNKTENALQDRPYTGGDVIIIFFSIMMGGFSLGQATPCLKNFSLGQQAAFKVFSVIDAKPLISPSLEKGEKIQNLKGNIVLRDVDFTYPMKQDVKVLNKINVTIQPGLKTALVGESGCGKSTIMQLIERFYDVDSGSVTVDDKNIKSLDLKWYRDNVGYVGQEPVLFAATIKENLLYGKTDATQEELERALQQAEALDFVNHLEDKLDTFVGTAGSQLSGGQKQRLCIARAILKNPSILLFDEATSALDRANERSIQETLDQISKNRTTIVIAHRLTTIQNSDVILVIDQGIVIEEGNHQSLLNKGGKYAALCQNQLQGDADEEGEGQGGLQNKEPRKDLEGIQKEAINIEDPEIQVKSNKKDKIVETPQQKKERLKKEKLEKKQAAKLKSKEEKSMVNKLYSINKPEKSFMWIGGIFSFIGGTSFPFCALIMAQMMDILARVDYMSKDEFRDKSNEMCLYFLIIALVTFISMILQFASWKRVSEGLTLRIREQTFKKILNMRTEWFEEPDNNPGTLSARLGSDTQLVNGLTSTIVNIQISNLSAFLSGVGIAFAFDWRTTLVGIVCFPVMFAAGGIQAEFMAGFSELTDAGYKDSVNLVSEAVVNMRTVASFGNENSILKAFSDKLLYPASLIGARSNKAGIAFGFSQFVMFAIYATLFYVGAIFHREYDVPALNMFTALFALMYAAFGAGNNAQFMIDVGAAYNAAKNLFKVLESEDELQTQSPNAIKEGKIEGNIEFQNVTFQYPSRDKLILNDISFKINVGQKIAFVGPSGCGKSTIMQLIMRFYEIKSGKILLDGRDIKEYDIKFLRSQFGVVSQEPVLFAGTIDQNIRYNTTDITEDDVIRAAKLANAQNFIESNEVEVHEVDEEIKSKNSLSNGKGYQRQVGNKGNQLSGGQKQRIAIARAIIKQPKILLLDEATSALDNTNEAIVQDSLNKIMENKTTLSIAHRISTIKDSDNILVIEEGKIVEQGKYNELVAKKEFFYRLERGDYNN